MTNHIYATEDFSTLNATTSYDDSNSSFSLYDFGYGSTEANINGSFNGS